MCKHWQDPMTVGTGVVWLSGAKNKGKRAIPDLAIMLDTDWLRILNTELVIRGSNLEGFSPEGEAILVPWKDFSTYDQGRFVALIKLAAEYVRAGKVVEVGCMGGHGRTGTFVAGLLVKVEGLRARAAIQAVRDRYCHEAVETQDQQKMIFKLTREKFEPLKIPKKGGGKSNGLVDPEFDYLDSKVTTGSNRKWWENSAQPRSGALALDIDNLPVYSALDQAKEQVRSKFRPAREEDLEKLSQVLKKKERLTELEAVIDAKERDLTDTEWEELEKLEDWEEEQKKEQDPLTVCKDCGFSVKECDCPPSFEIQCLTCGEDVDACDCHCGQCEETLLTCVCPPVLSKTVEYEA